MPLIPRYYQQKAVDKMFRKTRENGLRKLCVQAATGAGKTVIFSTYINQALQQQPDKRVLITVHREELLKQARKTLFDWYGIVAQPIVSGVRYAPSAQVYVSMVETANNRLKTNPRWFGDVGTMIVDECHRGEHKKLYGYFPDQNIFGFSATPISSSKKDPLNNYFEDIVTTIDIPELIEQKALTPNRTYHIKNINREKLSKLGMSNGDFDNKKMGAVFSTGKHVQNTVDAYEKFSKGTKAIVFNCNREHNELVYQEFTRRGYPCMHYDSKMDKSLRKVVLDWYAATTGAILCNVDIFTTGFDDPSVQTIIVNRSTMSVALWLQMTGRGSRLFLGKQFFTIIDMGGNALSHGDWCAPRDWTYLFHNPDAPSKDKEGIIPQKECIQCEALIPTQAKICPFCGADNSKTLLYDDGIPEFELVTTGIKNINVERIVVDSLGRNDYYALHNIKGQIVSDARRRSATITTEQVYELLSAYHSKVQEWCKIKGKNFDQWHKDTTANWLFDEIENKFGWAKPKLSLAI